jgi:hypothetical protein
MTWAAEFHRVTQGSDFFQLVVHYASSATVTYMWQPWYLQYPSAIPSEGDKNDKRRWKISFSKSNAKAMEVVHTCDSSTQRAKVEEL